MAMHYGFLTLMFFSLSLYGFWGVVWLPVYPLMLLLVVGMSLYFSKRIKYSGFTRGFIESDAVFWKFSVEYHHALWVTLLLLSLYLFSRGSSGREFIDFDNFEISKVSFRQTMGFLAVEMGALYFTTRLVSVLLEPIRPSERGYEENAMVFGLLTVAFFLMNLFGFLGLMWILVSPPVILLLKRH